MNRGKAHQTIFHNEKYYVAFLETLAESHIRFNAIFHSYCLMPNHYHLVIETPEANLGRIMRHINGVFTQRYNRLHQTDGPLFRGRYKAILIEADLYLLQLTRYIHRNPIQSKKLVTQLHDWPWSSYLAYICDSIRPFWLNRDKVLNMLSAKNKIEAYSNFVNQGENDEVKEFFNKESNLVIMGSDTFKDNVLQYTKIPKESAHKYLAAKPDSKKIIEATANVFKIAPEVITTKPSGRLYTNLARDLAVFCCQQLSDMKLNDIAQQFHFSSMGSVAGCLSKAKQKLKDEKVHAKFLEIQYELHRRR
jgi:REP element-mobilizing transposase RayT